MSLIQLDTENADRNLTSSVTCLTHTPTVAAWCVGEIRLGDGVKNLSGAGGNFELVVTVAGQTIQPSPQIINFGAEVRSTVWTVAFPVRANEEVILKIKSPNAADSDVDVVAYLHDITGALPAALPGAVSGLPINDASTAYTPKGMIDKLNNICLEGTVNDAGASTTVFITTLTGLGVNQILKCLVAFTSGALQGISRPITGYVTATGQITVTDPFPTAPANGVSLKVLGYYG